MLAIGMLCIRLQCGALVFHAWGSIINMFYAGIGKGKQALAMSTARQGYCLIPVALIAPFLWKATGIAATQAIAENGPQVFQGPEKILPYPDDSQLPPADGIMLLDANWGNAAMQLFGLDPAVVSENGGMRLDPAYNLFEEANGFRKEGSTFSGEFIQRFQKKQGERNNQILSYALERWEKIKKGEGRYSDDEPLVIPGANQVFFNNKLYAQDIRLMSHTRRPRELIHADGSSTVEIVYSVRGPENPESMTHNMMDGARIMTVYNYLTSYAVRKELIIRSVP